jgi:hypothetical protein
MSEPLLLMDCAVNTCVRVVSLLLQHTEQVVSQLVRALSELPEGWTVPQNGPLQVQADFTQLMLDLRG